MSGPNVGLLSVSLIDVNYYFTLMWQLTGTQTNSSEWREGRLPIPPTDNYAMVCRPLVVMSCMEANYQSLLEIFGKKPVKCLNMFYTHLFCFPPSCWCCKEMVLVMIILT